MVASRAQASQGRCTATIVAPRAVSSSSVTTTANESDWRELVLLHDATGTVMQGWLERVFAGDATAP